jgi:translation initiation factor 3 subunit A
LAAKKQGLAAPARPVSRDVSDRAPPVIGSSGRPPLVLQGNKPSWREREAAKASGASQSPAAAAEPETAAPPRRTGAFIPPALRARGEDGSPAPTAGGWRGREGSGRGREPRDESPAVGGNGRYESPAAGGGRYAAPASRAAGSFRDTGDRNRTQSPATGGKFMPPALRGRPEGAREEEPKEAAPLPPPAASSDGKYRPGMFSSRRGA